MPLPSHLQMVKGEGMKAKDGNIQLRLDYFK